MRTQLKALEIEVLLSATEKEARILNMVASFIRHKAFHEHFSRELPRGVTPEEFDGVMAHLHSHTGRVLKALDDGREKIAGDLREASR